MSRSHSLSGNSAKPGRPAHGCPKSKMPFLKCKSDHVLARLQNLPTGMTPGLAPWQSRLPRPQRLPPCKTVSVSSCILPSLPLHTPSPHPNTALPQQQLHLWQAPITPCHSHALIHRSPPPGMQLPLESLFPFSREPFLCARPTHLAGSCLLPVGSVWTLSPVPTLNFSPLCCGSLLVDCSLFGFRSHVLFIISHLAHRLLQNA